MQNRHSYCCHCKGMHKVYRKHLLEKTIIYTPLLHFIDFTVTIKKSFDCTTIDTRTLSGVFSVCLSLENHRFRQLKDLQLALPRTLRGCLYEIFVPSPTGAVLGVSPRFESSFLLFYPFYTSERCGLRFLDVGG